MQSGRAQRSGGCRILWSLLPLPTPLRASASPPSPCHHPDLRQGPGKPCGYRASRGPGKCQRSPCHRCRVWWSPGELAPRARAPVWLQQQHPRRLGDSSLTLQGLKASLPTLLLSLHVGGGQGVSVPHTPLLHPTISLTQGGGREKGRQGQTASRQGPGRPASAVLG